MSVKYDDGKEKIYRGFMEYFPRAIKEITRVSEFGAEKYGAFGGWKDVLDGFNRYSDAMGRHHLLERVEVQEKESKILHSAFVAWNALARLELFLEGRDEKIEALKIACPLDGSVEVESFQDNCVGGN